MSYQTTNKLVALFNKMLFSNAPLVVRSIRSKTMIGLGASVGVGFSDKSLEKIKTFLKLDNIPNISGFYLMTTLGFTVHYVERNGKKRLRFASFNLENRWATEIYSPFAVAAGGLVLTYANSTKLEDAPGERGEFLHTSLANLNQSETEYGATGRFMTPIIPAGELAVFKGQYANYKLSPVGIAALTADVFRFILRRKSNRCVKSLQFGEPTTPQ